MFKTVTYVSAATARMPTGQLQALLAAARTNNERDEITGMLLYRDGNFMQCVEGPAAAIDALRSRLADDPRHTRIIELISGQAEQRRFDGWSMGFRDLSGDSADLAGFSEFLQTPLTADAFGSDPAASQRLLLSFKRHSR